jgi:hypothetical protein
VWWEQKSRIWKDIEAFCSDDILHLDVYGKMIYKCVCVCVSVVGNGFILIRIFVMSAKEQNLERQRCFLLIFLFKIFKSVHHRTIQINFSVHYPDVYLHLNKFQAFSRPLSGAQWLQWQPLVLSSYRGDSRVVFVVGTEGPTTNTARLNVKIIKWKIVASDWWFISIVFCSANILHSSHS